MKPEEAESKWVAGVIELLALLPDCRWVEARDLLDSLAPVLEATKNLTTMKAWQYFYKVATYGADATPSPVEPPPDDD